MPVGIPAYSCTRSPRSSGCRDAPALSRPGCASSRATWIRISASAAACAARPVRRCGPTPTMSGLKAAKAIDRPFPQAVPATYPHRPRSLPQRRVPGLRTLRRRPASPTPSISTTCPRKPTLDVGAVVVATGFDELDPARAAGLRLRPGAQRDDRPGVRTAAVRHRPDPGRVLRPTDHQVPEPHRLRAVRRARGARADGPTAPATAA